MKIGGFLKIWILVAIALLSIEVPLAAQDQRYLRYGTEISLRSWHNTYLHVDKVWNRSTGFITHEAKYSRWVLIPCVTPPIDKNGPARDPVTELKTQAEVRTGDWVALKFIGVQYDAWGFLKRHTYCGYFLTLDRGGSAYANRATEIENFELIKIYSPGGILSQLIPLNSPIQLQSAESLLYLVAEPNEEINANRKDPGHWETWFPTLYAGY